MFSISKVKNIVKIGALIACCAPTMAVASDVVLPSKITKEEVTGKIFDRPSMVREVEGKRETLDVLTMTSSDKKFETGMYQAGPSYYDFKGAEYGVDEFMYFIKGSVKLTSADGSVQVINAGEAVSLPKEWTGIWETEGYTKFYVIYTSEEKSE